MRSRASYIYRASHPAAAATGAILIRLSERSENSAGNGKIRALPRHRLSIYKLGKFILSCLRATYDIPEI